MKHDYQLMNINSLWKIRENWEPLIYLVTGVPFADTSWGIGFAPRATATHMIEDIMELVTVWKSCLIGNLVKEEVKPGITCKCECVCVYRNMQAVRKCSSSERSRELVPEILLSWLNLCFLLMQIYLKTLLKLFKVLRC